MPIFYSRIERASLLKFKKSWQTSRVHLPLSSQSRDEVPRQPVRRARAQHGHQVLPGRVQEGRLRDLRGEHLHNVRVDQHALAAVPRRPAALLHQFPAG